jgi:hypothetical protein
MKSTITIKNITVGAALFLSVTQASAGLSDKFTCVSNTLGQYTLECSHWYVAGNIGVSHLYDAQAPKSSDSVDENGPGWDAAIGYQINSMLGGELGYTQYYNSRETTDSTVVAKTTHFAVHLNATGRYPLVYKLNALGKLGVAYSYAQKVFSLAGIAASSGAVSPYLGLGLDYSITPKVDMIAQWAFVRGNHYTGSSVLYSLGMAFAIT